MTIGSLPAGYQCFLCLLAPSPSVMRGLVCWRSDEGVVILRLRSGVWLSKSSISLSPHPSQRWGPRRCHRDPGGRGSMGHVPVPSSTADKSASRSAPRPPSAAAVRPSRAGRGAAALIRRRRGSPPAPCGRARGYSSDPTTSRAPQRPVLRGLVRRGDMRGGGGTTVLPPVPLCDLLIAPAVTSSFAAGVSPRAGPARPHGGGKGHDHPRRLLLPHAAGPRVHRPRRRAPCQVRGRSLRAIRRGDDVSPLPPAAARPHPARDLPCESRFRLRE